MTDLVLYEYSGQQGKPVCGHTGREQEHEWHPLVEEKKKVYYFKSNFSKLQISVLTVKAFENTAIPFWKVNLTDVDKYQLIKKYLLASCNRRDIACKLTSVCGLASGHYCHRWHYNVWEKHYHFSLPGSR